MSDKLHIYSVAINWNDRDREQGDWGTVVRARDRAHAEELARKAMREFYIENECDEGADEDEINAMCESYDGGDPAEFGDSVVSCERGAIWKAAELEEALRELLEIMPAPMDFKAANRIESARKLLAEIDASAEG